MKAALISLAIATLMLTTPAFAAAQSSDASSAIAALRAEIAALRAIVEQLHAALYVTATELPPVAVVGDGPSGSMPIRWARTGAAVHNTTTAGHALTGVFGIAQHRGTDGGPQALEGYVYSNPPRGESVRLAMSLIGNGEHAGAGTTVEMRSPGGVVSGPGRVETWFMHRPIVDVLHPEGEIDRLVAYSAEFPRHNVGEKWGVRFDDPTVRHRLAGEVIVGTLRFETGWTLLADREGLALVRPDGTIERVFR